MITGIIFVCAIEQAVCKPLAVEFDSVQECNIVITEMIKEVGVTPGVASYYVCDPGSQPL